MYSLNSPTQEEDHLEPTLEKETFIQKTTVHGLYFSVFPQLQFLSDPAVKTKLELHEHWLFLFALVPTNFFFSADLCGFLSPFTFA